MHSLQSKSYGTGFLSRYPKYKEESNMKYVCEVCGWVFDEDEQGKKWEEVGDDFECPLCAVGKDQFSPEE